MKMTIRNIAILKQRIKKFDKAYKDLAAMKASPDYSNLIASISATENWLHEDGGFNDSIDRDLYELKSQSNGKGGSYTGSFWKGIVRDDNKINSIDMKPGAESFILTTFNHEVEGFDIKSYATGWELKVAEFKYWLSVYPL